PRARSPASRPTEEALDDPPRSWQRAPSPRRRRPSARSGRSRRDGGESMASVPLHPSIERIKDRAPFPTLDAATLAAVRDTKLVEALPLSDRVERTDHVVRGDPRLVVRVHRPVDAEGKLACVFSIHGGGYVLGSYEMDDAKFDRWCPTYGIVGVSVEYRLAPEHPYPAPLEDCYAALEWTSAHPGQPGTDPARIGISGGSAGGGRRGGLAL